MFLKDEEIDDVRVLVTKKLRRQNAIIELKLVFRNEVPLALARRYSKSVHYDSVIFGHQS